MNFRSVKHKIFNLKDLKIKHFLLIVVIFFPKLDLFQLPFNGVQQGPRIDDIVLLVFVLHLLISNKSHMAIWSDKFIFKNWLIFFSILMFFNIVHLINGKNLNLIVLIRIFEYTILIVFLNNLLNKNNIYLIIKSFIIINFVIALLQTFGLIGSLSSIGYLGPDHILNQRAYGILGGSWELGIVSGILGLTCFRARNYMKNYLFYMFICSINVFLGYGITNLIAYTLCLIFILLIVFFKKIKKFSIQSIFYTFIIILLSTLIIYFSNFYINFLSKLLSNEFLIRLSKVDFFYLFDVYKGFFTAGMIPELKEVKDPLTHYSIILRLETWQNPILEFQDKNLSKLIGIGIDQLYLESLIIRVITATGIVGCIFIFYSILNIPLYFLIFIMISGINIDLFISIKIFIFTFLFFKINQLAKHGNNIT
jgi:hypothetical protein